MTSDPPSTSSSSSFTKTNQHPPRRGGDEADVIPKKRDDDDVAAPDASIPPGGGGHHRIPMISVGVLAPSDTSGTADGAGRDEQEDEGEDDGRHSSYAERLAGSIRRMAPDRFRVVIFDTDTGGSDDASSPPSSPSNWPSVHVLVACASRPGFPSGAALEYVRRCHPQIVLSDFELQSTTTGDARGGGVLSDRRAFYDVLDAHARVSDGDVARMLPMRAYASRDWYGQRPPPGCRDAPRDGEGEDDKRHPHPRQPFIVMRREHVEIDGAVILKPFLERPADPADDDVRIYYPMSSGGGCKFLGAVSDGRGGGARRDIFRADVNSVRALDDDDPTGGSSYIYEELVDAEESARRVDRRSHWRKRDRLVSMAKRAMPDMEAPWTQSSIPEYADDDEVTYESDLSRTDRNFFIVTTAALPWMTGTAVNPLLRAAYLKRGRPDGSVTLVVPWLEREEDREAVYGKDDDTRFDEPPDQERYIRRWLRERADMPEEADPDAGIRILFYPARYHPALVSIFAVGGMCRLIPDADADVCVLEEPEHLNWFRAAGEAWTEKFRFVVGIVHTNYRAYASAEYAGVVLAPIVAGASTLMVRAYCHRVIKLSPVLQTFAPEKETVSNVHGVRSEFVREGGRRRKASLAANAQQEDKGNSDEAGIDEGQDCCVYFVGKNLWAKGLDKMTYLQHFYKECTGAYFEIDIYGDGPELSEIKRAYHGRSSGKKRRAFLKYVQSYHSDIGGDESSTDEDERRDDKDSSAESSQRRQVTSNATATSDSDTNGKNWDPPGLKQLSYALKSTMEFEVPKSIHEWRMNPIPAKFLGRKDHALLTKKYKVFVNPSITEVLCTTTAEALAMGKFAIIPAHPSNTFFMQFPNCLAFQNKLEFAANLQWALTHDPEPLTEELSHRFTWEAATERFIAASAVTMKDERRRAKAQKTKVDERIAFFHNKISKLGTRTAGSFEGPSCGRERSGRRFTKHYMPLKSTIAVLVLFVFAIISTVLVVKFSQSGSGAIPNWLNYLRGLAGEL